MKSESIGSISFICAQIYEPMGYSEYFREVSEDLALLQAKQFALLDPTHYLLHLTVIPTLIDFPRSIQLSTTDYSTLKHIFKGIDAIALAVQMLGRRKKVTTSGEDDDY